MVGDGSTGAGTDGAQQEEPTPRVHVIWTKSGKVFCVRITLKDIALAGHAQFDDFNHQHAKQLKDSYQVGMKRELREEYTEARFENAWPVLYAEVLRQCKERREERQANEVEKQQALEQLVQGRIFVDWKPENLDFVADEVEAILGKLDPPRVFVRSESLNIICQQHYITSEEDDTPSEVITGEDPKDEGAADKEPDLGITDATQAPVHTRFLLNMLEVNGIRAELSRHILFKHRLERVRQGRCVEIGPVPRDVALTLNKRVVFPRTPPLRGLSSIPILRMDGSVSSTRGYDRRSTWFLTHGFNFDLPERVDRDLAMDEFAFFMTNVCGDFPFTSEEDRAAAAALAVTFVMRTLLDPEQDECMPAFVSMAHVPGTGKTLLAKAIHLAVTGVMPFTQLLPHTEEEWSKAMLALAIQGAESVLFDNAPSGKTIQSSAFEAAVTSTSISGRYLGRSKNVRTTLHAVQMITGNNLGFSQDLPRRCIFIRQDAKDTRPELRGGFRHQDLLPWIHMNRARLLKSLYTALRGFLQAGMPDHGLARLGGFEQWDKLVRRAVIWMGYEDPAATQEEVVETADVDRMHREELISALSDVFEDRTFTSKDVLAAAMHGRDQPPRIIEGKASLEASTVLYQALVGPRPHINAVIVGLELRKQINAPTRQGKILRKVGETRDCVAEWQVQPWTAESMLCPVGDDQIGF